MPPEDDQTAANNASQTGAELGTALVLGSGTDTLPKKQGSIRPTTAVQKTIYHDQSSISAPPLHKCTGSRWQAEDKAPRLTRFVNRCFSFFIPMGEAPPVIGGRAPPAGSDKIPLPLLTREE